MRSPLTATYQRINALVDQVNALSEDERGLFLDLLLPESEEPVKQKKTRKKRARKQRIGIQAALAEAKPILCGACGNTEEFEDHLLQSSRYHRFDAGKEQAAAAGD